MLPPSSVTRNPSKQKRSASCAELWIIGRSDTTTQRRNDATTLRASRYRLFGKLGARHGESVRRRTWSGQLARLQDHGPLDYGRAMEQRARTWEGRGGSERN